MNSIKISLTFSAVDPKVSRHLFEECARGYLKDKLVILVTHQLQYLGQADNVVVLNEVFLPLYLRFFL